MTEQSHDSNREKLNPVMTKLVRTDELLGEKKELQIDHEGEIYRLRITRNGKLILTK